MSAFINQLNKIQLVYLVTLILAFSSIVYELLLGQALSAFFGNTVLSYSITVGLYLFAMGVGAFVVEKRFLKHAVLKLLIVECIIITLGGGSIILLHAIHSLHISSVLLSIFGYSLIFIIGILTGFEIPLLMDMANQKEKKKENIILGINYFGAFLGSIMFAFYFYPVSGLVKTAFVVALLNTVGGLLLIGFKDTVPQSVQRSLMFTFFIIAILGGVVFVGFINADIINEYLIKIYLNT